MAKVVPINKDGPGPIEHGVPIPKRQIRESMYAFDQMKVGDSFTVPKAKGTSAWRIATRYASSHRGVEFTTRTEGDRVRVWRVK